MRLASSFSVDAGSSNGIPYPFNAPAEAEFSNTRMIRGIQSALCLVYVTRHLTSTY